LSDIFKKIRSIEAEDDDVTKALGLSLPKNEARPPIRLSIPDDDDVLDLDDLSLEAPKDAANLDIPALDETQTSPSKSRLGLKPILPLKSPPQQTQPVVEPSSRLSEAPRRSAVSNVDVEPLPNFMAHHEEDLPSPEILKNQIENSDRADMQTASSAQQSHNSLNNKVELLEGKSSMGRFVTIAGILTAIVWLVCVGIFLSGLLKSNGAWAVKALMTPDDTVITRSTIMAKSIQSQVDEVNLKVSSALTRMELLDDMVKSQGSSLAKSTIAIETTTGQIEDRITAQRNGLESIANLFEGRMETLSHMMEGHSSQLASSGQMAEQRVEEARVSVESAAERIASASETVRQNAVAAAQTLSGSQIEITKLGDDVQAQSTRLDAVYRQHLTDLKAMLSDLRGQQDELAATMEERLSKMRDMSLSAKVGAQSLTEASIKGRETVEALNEAASLTDTAVRARFSEMEEMVKYSTARAESISETAARQVQNSLSTTRKEIARIEADMMDLMDKLGNAEAVKSTLTAPQTQTPSLRRDQFTEPPFMDNTHSADTAESSRNTEPSLYKLRGAIERTAPPPPTPASADLDFHDPETEDLPAILKRPSGDSGSKDRGKWSLRGLFTPEEQDSPPIIRSVSDDDIISKLTKLGLTPAAIVDDGCIIEAANLRVVKGALAMSEAVARRLGEPVRHLFLAIETDAMLKLDITQFATQFNSRIAPLESNRESIRKELESEVGRAYLLCDAALNA